MKPKLLEDCEIDVIECDCGYHMGFDSSYLLQVEDIKAICPSCGATINTRIIKGD